MSNITAADVNKLRQQTGAGMMDCKKALTESEGDFEKAIEILRKKGQKVASNRSDRDANEGYVVAKTTADSKKVIVLMLNCETDFVAKNQEFVNFGNSIMDVAIANAPKNIEELLNLQLNGRSIADQITDNIGKIGEKIQVSQYGILEGAKCYAYNHPGSRIASIVSFNKADVANLDQIGKDIAMQIAAMSPVAVDKDDVDPRIVEKEIEIGKEQARQEGKPEEMLEKIALGKLNKFYKESTLMNQEFIKDNKLTVGQYVKSADKDLTVLGLRRLALGQQ